MSNNTPTNSVTLATTTAESRTGFQLPTLEELQALAKHQPEKLESLRQAGVEHIIQSAPPHRQQRLRGLQFQIDAIRRGSKNPMHGCVRLHHVMMTSLARLQSAAESIHSNTTAAHHRPSPSKAKILPFLQKKGRCFDP